MEWIADFNPEAITSDPPTAIIRIVNPEIHHILDELGVTLLAVDLTQVTSRNFA